MGIVELLEKCIRYDKNPVHYNLVVLHFKGDENGKINNKYDGYPAY